jgi:predicted TIM-barrel fold metal-dependent hydrolase
MWGSDFPHVRSVALDTQSEVGQMLANLPTADQNRIVAENVTEVYRLD